MLNLHREEKTLSKDRHLVHKGTKIKSVFILQEGKLKSVSTVKGGKQENILRFIEPGCIIGYFDEPDNAQWNFPIIAVEPSVICAFPYPVFKELLITDNRLVHHVLSQTIRELGKAEDSRLLQKRMEPHRSMDHLRESMP